jgi:S-adenosylmethionine synthetase
MMKEFEVEICHTPTGQYVTFTVEYPEDYHPDYIADLIMQDVSIDVSEV